MKIIPGGIADRKGKKVAANIETMVITERYASGPGVGKRGTDNEFSGERKQWEATIINPLIARNGEVY